MSRTIDYDSLTDEERIEHAWAAVEDNDDHARKLLTNHATHEIEEGTTHASGEPKNTWSCAFCCTSIPLGDDAAALKHYTCEHGRSTTTHQDSEIICSSCADTDDRLVKPGRVGVLVRGTLSRRRTRPGDDSAAPYLFYLDTKESLSPQFVAPGAQAAYGWGALNDDND